MHSIDEHSPLNGQTNDSLRRADAEIIVTLVGIDDTTGQFVHARCSYLDDEVLSNHHFVDLVTELPDGRINLDLTHFNEVEPDSPS
jgi:inward rectifier potassium channel